MQSRSAHAAPDPSTGLKPACPDLNACSSVSARAVVGQRIRPRSDKSPRQDRLACGDAEPQPGGGDLFVPVDGRDVVLE